MKRLTVQNDKYKNKMKSVDEDVEILVFSYTEGGKVNWYSHFRNQCSSLL